MQQKQTQLILYPQYVPSKEKQNPRRISLGESFEKDPNVAYLYTYTALEEPLKAIFDNLIKIAVNENFDLLTVSDLMNVSDVLLCRKSNITSVFKKEEYEKVFEYKFIKGVETKYFNLFNLTSPDVKSDQISILIPN